MKRINYNLSVIILIVVTGFFLQANAQEKALSPKEQGLIGIAASAAKGNLPLLKTKLNAGLDSGLNINEAKEAIVHLYAYCGFPRSLRGLQTLMSVLDERKAKGIQDPWGRQASPINNTRPRYDRGRDILGKLTGMKQDGPATGYAAFSPEIDSFLKEHLFADIFERDILTYVERELVTVSVLICLGGVEPMLQSHMKICLNLGVTSRQLERLIDIAEVSSGKQNADAARAIIAGINRPSAGKSISTNKHDQLFPTGTKITNANFTGTAFLHQMIAADNDNDIQVGNVTFEPGARTKWHLHPGGQILLVTDGVGYYQEKGSAKKILRKGETIKCSPNVPHWHGASADTAFIQIAITSSKKGSTQWLHAVTEDEYHGR